MINLPNEYCSHIKNKNEQKQSQNLDDDILDAIVPKLKNKAIEEDKETMKEMNPKIKDRNIKINALEKPKAKEEKEKTKEPKILSQNDGKRVLPNYFNNNSPKKLPALGRKRKHDEIESDDKIKSSEPEFDSSDSEKSTPKAKPKKRVGPRIKIVKDKKEPQNCSKRSKKMDIPAKKNLIIEGKRPRRKPKQMGL